MKILTMQSINVLLNFSDKPLSKKCKLYTVKEGIQSITRKTGTISNRKLCISLRTMNIIWAMTLVQTRMKVRQSNKTNRIKIKDQFECYKNSKEIPLGNNFLIIAIVVVIAKKKLQFNCQFLKLFKKGPLWGNIRKIALELFVFVIYVYDYIDKL